MGHHGGEGRLCVMVDELIADVLLPEVVEEALLGRPGRTRSFAIVHSSAFVHRLGGYVLPNAALQRPDTQLRASYR